MDDIDCFVYDQLNKRNKESFIQEFLYIEESPIDKDPHPNKDDEEDVERGVVVINILE